MDTYREYGDYGVDGINPREIRTIYRPDDAYEIPAELDQKISDVWSQILKRDRAIHDSKLLYLTEITDGARSLHLGQGAFREYYVVWSSLHSAGFETDIQLSKEEKEFVGRNIHALSVVTPIVAGDEVVLGIKETAEGYWVGFPGSGYLEVEKDTTEEGGIRPLNQVLRRELEEELGVSEGVSSIDCLGLFSEEVDGLCINPAVISIANTDLNSTDIVDNFGFAEDSWEFEAVFCVPMLKSTIESLIRGRFRELDVEIPPEVTGDETSLAPKASLVFALLGRHKFGRRWFQETISNSFSIYSTNGLI